MNVIRNILNIIIDIKEHPVCHQNNRHEATRGGYNEYSLTAGLL